MSESVSGGPMPELILSVFPGLDLLGDAFAALGSVVVESRDKVLLRQPRRAPLSE